MYNLIMSGLAGFWDDRRVKFPRDRFLEHTDDAIKVNYEILTQGSIDEAKKLPTLLAYEAGRESGWYLARIIEIVLHPREIELEVDFEPSSPLKADKMVELARELGISNIELHRTHWSIKDVDLADVLGRHDLLPEAGNEPARQPRRYNRKTLLAATRLLQHTGHAELDDLLAEIGIAEISAGRDVGGRQARAAALGGWVMRHPDASTAEGEQLGDFLVKHATRTFEHWNSPDGPPQIANNHWRAFEAALQEDEHVMIGGSVMNTSVTRALRSLGSPPPKATGRQEPLLELTTKARSSVANRKVFVVHGRDSAMKETVARFLERVGLQPVILHEQPNKGRTLFTKFQEVAGEASFAVALLHPDDLGNLAADVDKGLNPRARQNVILEMGFFVGKLGADRVVALVNGRVEKPSDFEGVVYVAYGDGLAWRLDLARELQAADVPFDSSKVY